MLFGWLIDTERRLYIYIYIYITYITPCGRLLLVSHLSYVLVCAQEALDISEHLGDGHDDEGVSALTVHTNNTSGPRVLLRRTEVTP